MRLIRLHAGDFELFKGSSDGDFDYFNNHLSEFKQMWKEQGQTFWVRFLLAYREYFLANIDTRCVAFTYLLKREGERASSFFLIFIHKQFIERSAERAARFIKDASLAWKYINTLPIGRMDEADPSMCNVELFKSLLGNPSAFNELPNELVAYAVSCFSDFSGVVCNLIKKWVDETDLSEESVKKIDSSLVYWRPDLEAKKIKNHNCFEKYLSDYWKNELPKMILIRDALNLLSFPGSCCSELKGSNIFDLLKNEMRSPENRMKQIDVISPDLVECKMHTDCFLLLTHKENCAEPFLCDGVNETCTLDCEVSRKTKKRSCSSSKLVGTMTFEVQNTSNGSRTVSTQIGDEKEMVTTLYNGKEKFTCEAYGQCEYMSLQENLCAQADYEWRNYYRQRSKKNQMKMRLRNKLDKKQMSQLEQHFDQDAALKLYDRATSAWKMDFCKENYQNIGNMAGLKPCKALLYGKNFEQFKKLMTSVVVSTSDAIFGRVVIPSEQYSKALKSTNSKFNVLFREENKDVPLEKKLKKKRKKKANSNNADLSGELPSTSNSETVRNGDPTLLNENKTDATSTSTSADSYKDSVSSRVSSPDEPLKVSKGVEEKSEEVVPALSSPGKEPKSSNDKSAPTKTKLSNVKESLDVFKESAQSGDKEVEEPSLERILTVKEEETVDKFFELIGLDPNPGNVDNQNVSSKISNRVYRICANCTMKEEEYKSFKRCSRCKVEKFSVQHYYCSRSCQIADWHKCHREDHLRSFNTC